MYVGLHNHSEHSVSDGLFSPTKWADAYQAKGFKAAALTDHGTLSGLLEFYKAMKERGLIPILGAEFYFTPDPLLKDKEHRKANHIILLAKNYDGFQNLMQLSKLSFTDGFYFKPRIGLEWLAKYSDNLVCLTACQGGVLSNEIWREQAGDECVGLEKRFKMLHKIFGDDLYVEFQSHNTVHKVKDSDEEFDSQEMINRALYERLKKTKGFQPIASNDCHYILPEHAKIQVLLKQMAWKNSDAGQSYTHCDSLWLKDEKNLYNTFRKNHEYLPKEFLTSAIKNTEGVLDKCNGLVFPTKRYLPTYRPKVDSGEFFKKLTTAHLRAFLKRGVLSGKPSDYIERFAKEYTVITKYGLQDYFLIVWDIVRFAAENKIFVGLGRGSSAGSLISYLLGIVKLDPLKYDLIFERFLNENRCVSGEMPDIDLDFESERRDEIKKYIFKTYGSEKVCEIGTYGRMKLKTSLIDFGKALGVANQRELLDITTKLTLDKDEANDLVAAAESDRKLQALLDGNEDYAFIVSEIMGQIKSQGIHPAGMVICSDPVASITPVKTQKSTGDDGKPTRVVVTQSEDKYVIAQGIMKMDILGLKEYDVIKAVIEKAPGCELTVDNYLEKILAEDDPKVWKYFQKGKTDGVFQFASSGMKALLVDMRPDSIEDLMAANALFRPGCLENGWHTLYCNRKHGIEAVEYVHPDVETALGKTYGVIVYQEAFMEVIHRLGGVSLVDSDTIRSALGKKDKKKLAKFQSQFIKNATKKIGLEEAEALWEQIEKASGYTFNKAHAAVYSVLAYVSQYLKIKYPAYFWGAQLEWDLRKNKTDDMLSNRRAAAEMGVRFVNPHINKSRSSIFVEKERVHWSFRGIKGIGPKAADEIEANQPFTDFDDFYKRVNKSRVKYNNIQALIFSGAFDEFQDRKQLLRDLVAKTKAKGKRYTPLSDEDLVFKFYDSMGFFEKKLKKMRPFSRHCITESVLRDYDPREYVVVGGMLTSVRAIKTRNGDPMGFATLMDLDEMIELTLFPKEWATFREVVKEGFIVEVSGQKSTFGGKQNLIEVKNIEKR